MLMRLVQRVLLLAVAMIVGTVAAQAETVTGSAHYRERIALPPNAVFVAQLLDVSLADAPSVEIGRAVIEPAGNPPFPFRIDYDAQQIKPGHTYTVSAKVTVNGELMFVTDRTHAVLTAGSPDNVDILLKMVSRRAASKPIDTKNAPLVGTYWRIVSIGGRAVDTTIDRREPHLHLTTRHSQYEGTTGCNGLGGTYQLAETRLTFALGISTQMFCEGPIGQDEQDMKRALMDTTSWRIEASTLSLLANDGRVLSTLHADDR
jgi:putative lipoprotein